MLVHPPTVLLGLFDKPSPREVTRLEKVGSCRSSTLQMFKLYSGIWNFEFGV